MSVVPTAVLDEYRPPVMFSWKVALGIVPCLIAMHFSGLASTVLTGACVLATLVSPYRAIQGMMIATLIGDDSRLLFPMGPAAGILARVALIAFALRCMPLLRRSDLTVIWPVWLFALLCALTSAIQSPALAVSIMKIATFALAATATLVAFRRLSPEQLAKMQTWFLSLGVTLITLSALTYARPSLALGTNQGLQGLFAQPQALGIFIAPFAAWSLCGAFLMRRQANRLEIWFAVGSLLLILVTKARTAGFAAFLGAGIVVLARLLGGRRRVHAALGRPLLLAAAFALVLVAVAATTGKVGKVLTDYAFKGTQSETKDLGGAFYASRGGGVVSEWHNFLRHPLTGNGFGVYPDGKFPVGVSYVWGIPISAPIEKGFLPSAVLEEDGIPGAFCLALLILALGREAWRHPDLRWRALFCACLAINIGECVLLSPGGIGMADWLMIGLAVSASRAQATRQVGAVAARAASAARPRQAAPAVKPPGPALPGVPGWWTP